MNVQANSPKPSTLELALNKGNEDIVKLIILSGHRLQYMRKYQELDNVNETLLTWLKVAGFTGTSFVAGRGRPMVTGEVFTAQPFGELNLKAECRKVIRHRLLAVQSLMNVIYKVRQLGLPLIMQEYLLFDEVSLD